MRIYVACLASYNAGRLYGAWIDVSPDVSEMLESISTMLEGSPTPGAEEWEIHDHEDMPQVSSLAEAAHYAELVEKYSAPWVDAVWGVEHPHDCEGVLESSVEYESVEDWAWGQLEDRIPEDLHAYIDITSWIDDQMVGVYQLAYPAGGVLVCDG